MTVNPDRGIRITWASSRYVLGRHDGIRIRIDVNEVCEVLDDRLFAYRMLPINPQTGSMAGHFSHVCSPTDLHEFPADAPIAGQEPAWFRLSYVDVLVRSQAEADNFLDAVKEDIQRLKTTLDTIDTLEATVDELYGTDCPTTATPASVSSSSSVSESSESLGPLLSLTRTGTNEQSIGVGVAWSHIGTGSGSPVGVSDSAGANYSRVVLPTSFTSQVLLTQGYDFSALPAGAEIEGIEATLVIRKDGDSSESSASSESSESAQPCPQVCFLALHHPDDGLSNDKATFQCIEGPEWQLITEGGVADLWGLAWSAADLKRGEFGLSLVVGTPAELVEETIDVDGVEITVYYRG